MTTTDCLINAAFVFVVLRQARERKLDRRSLVLPLVAVYFVTQRYVHSIPTAGNDLVLLGVLASVGLTLGILCGFATNSEPVATASRSRGSAGLPVAC